MKHSTKNNLQHSSDLPATTSSPLHPLQPSPSSTPLNASSADGYKRKKSKLNSYALAASTQGSEVKIFRYAYIRFMQESMRRSFSERDMLRRAMINYERARFIDIHRHSYNRILLRQLSLAHTLCKQSYEQLLSKYASLATQLHSLEKRLQTLHSTTLRRGRLSRIEKHLSLHRKHISLLQDYRKLAAICSPTQLEEMGNYSTQLAMKYAAEHASQRKSPELDNPHNLNATPTTSNSTPSTKIPTEREESNDEPLLRAIALCERAKNEALTQLRELLLLDEQSSSDK